MSEGSPAPPAPAGAAEEQQQPDAEMAAAEPAAAPAAEGAMEAAAAAGGEANGAEAEAAPPAPPAAAEQAAATTADGDHKRDRSRSRDRDAKARSRSRSRDRHRSRSRDRRRRSRSRSRSRSADKPRRTRRSRFEEETEEEKEERRKKAAAAAAAAAALPGAVDPLAALKASNPALANLDPATTAALAQQLQRQQLMMQQQMLQQQAALQAQAVMSKAAKSQSSVDRMTEKQQKAQRELFVGNLTPGTVTEHSLYQVFHSALIAAFPQAAQPGQEPVIRVNITGRFAFVEFRLPEYATAALQLNGQIALMGSTLKIARPSSYVEPSQMHNPMMGGIMGGGLPGMGMGAAAGAPGMGLPGMPGMAPAGFPGIMPGMQLPGPPSGGAGDGLATPMPTPFLGVNGMITADVLDSDEEYKESCVLLDLAQECGKYGSMLGLKVPRPPRGTAASVINTGHYGKAFVQFADVPSAQRAKDAISGRMFAGNIVQAYHVPVTVYQAVPDSS